jgi:hypothetical protein
MNIVVILADTTIRRHPSPYTMAGGNSVKPSFAGAANPIDLAWIHLLTAQLLGAEARMSRVRHHGRFLGIGL